MFRLCVHTVGLTVNIAIILESINLLKMNIYKCPKREQSCSNNCVAKSVLSKDMEAHRKVCPLEVVQCTYHNVGCEERMMNSNRWKNTCH